MLVLKLAMPTVSQFVLLSRVWVAHGVDTVSTTVLA